MFAVLLFQRSRLVRAEAAWYDPSLADGCSLLLDPDMGELFRMACVDDFLRQGIWPNLGARMPLKCPGAQKIQVFSKVIFRAWLGEFFQGSGVPAHIVSLSLSVDFTNSSNQLYGEKPFMFGIHAVTILFFAQVHAPSSS